MSANCPTCDASMSWADYMAIPVSPVEMFRTIQDELAERLARIDAGRALGTYDGPTCVDAKRRAKRDARRAAWAMLEALA